MDWKNIATTALSAFAGGAMTDAMSLPPATWLSLTGAEHAIPGLLLAGLVALYHLYQPKPVAS